jgi:hypothetical protein
MASSTLESNALEQFLAACRTCEEGAITPALREAGQAFLRAANADPSLAADAIAAFATLPPAGAGWLCITLGILVEEGLDPQIAGPQLLSAYATYLSALPTPDDEENDAAADLSDEENARIEALEKISQSVVAHLARMPQERESLAQDEALLERLQALEDYGPGTGWVHEALSKTSGRLIVLHPESKQGLQLRYRNISTCFHLFSLLQQAIGRQLPHSEGIRADDAIDVRAEDRTHDAPTGFEHVDASDEDDFEDDEDEDETVIAWWHYGHPASPTPDIGSSIWGEASPRSIPDYDGEQVLLLWSPILNSRSWNGFNGYPLEAMPAEVLVESALTPEECASWLDRLGISHARD